MEGHSFWRSNQHCKGVQEWVLRNADEHSRKVCIVLQHQGRRLYTSFPDAHAFWKYYSKYKGRRCFYWINRSQELPGEISLLHFDVEWLSATPGDDPTTAERLHILKTAINSCLPTPCTFTEERLSRPSPKGGREWYNSWHLYADGVTFENNARGCMKPFAVDKVWKRIKTHPLMKCPIKGKPILDLSVYSKNRCWKVPGSTKWVEWTGENLALPEKNFFMKTRMSDRHGTYTYSAIELDIPGRSPHRHKAIPNPKRHTHTRVGRKRGASDVTTGDRPVASHKRRNPRQAPITKANAMSLTNTPGPDPNPTAKDPKHNSNQSTHHAPLRARSWIALDVRHDCPIPGCYNYGGRGYKDSTIIGHLQTHSAVIRHNPQLKAEALRVAGRIGPFRCCDRCGKLYIKVKKVGTEHICMICHRKIPKPDRVKKTLTAHRIQLATNRIRDANQTKFRIMDDIPARLRRLWGQCVHSTLDRYASARTDEDAFNALEAWAKLKVVLVLPLRGGRQKKESRRKTHQRMMIQWLAGDIEGCWREGLRIEQIRKSRSRKRQRGPHPMDKKGTTPTKTEERRKWDSAKRLVNIGEYRKAISALRSNGTATITESVLDQLRTKHPKRTRPINRPRPPFVESEDRDHNDLDEWDMLLPPPPDDHDYDHDPPHASGADTPNLRNNHQGETLGTNMDIELENGTTDPGLNTHADRGMETIPDEKDQTVRGNPWSWDHESSRGHEREPERNAPLNFPSLTVTAEDIRKAVKDVRRLTSGGLQQVTPWHLKRAILATSNEDCATAAAHLATRWSKGDYPLLLGELAAESKLIALFKDERKVDVRPISIGCPLRRLLTKAYCNKLRTEITRIVSPTQLGVLKGGYEIGVHAMRALAQQAETNGDAILLLDFENAFNTADRDLMISLSAKRCPDLTNLTWWLYRMEPKLITSGGDTIRSSTGTQQGCRLSNPSSLFS